jgi:hypothetical protein
MVPRGGIFLGKWRSTFAGSSDGKMNVQSACALNTLYLKRDIGWDDMDRIHLTQDRDQRQALVNTVMNFRVP